MKNLKLRLGHWKIPSSAKEWTQLLSRQQENSSTSEDQKEEAQKSTNKYEIRFVKYPKRRKRSQKILLLPLSLSAEKALKRVKAFFRIDKN